jgi:hypothetical protein
MPRTGLWLLIASVLTGCASRTTHVSPPATSAGLQLPYIDLQPGWRLRVVTPLTKSGTFEPDSMSREVQSSGGTTISTSADFIGYETSFYRVEPRTLGGVHVKFVSAEKVVDGVTTDQAVPSVLLFHLPGSARYIRLLYLARVSKSNHDMAVIAASRQNLLAQRTTLIQANPSLCENGDSSFCSWVPPGIAVRPESPASGTGKSWMPAR